MAEAQASEAGTCTIRVTRPSAFADLLRSYSIQINGRQVGSIGNGGMLEVREPAGTVTIEAKIDWGRSKPLTIQAAPDQTIEVEVRNNWGGLLSLWAITFGKNTYLKLTPKLAA
jgi:hypothetical protein